MGVIRPRFGGRWVAGLGRCVVVPPGPEMDARMSWSPCLIRSATPAGRVRVQLGHEVIDGGGYFPWTDVPDRYWMVINEFVLTATRA